MAYFKFAFNTAGKSAIPREFPIATGTAIEKGEIVKFTPGTGVVAIGDADQDDPVLGVALENHDGATADGRQTGLLIKVATDLNDVFELQSTEAQTLTGGSTTTAVISGLLPQTNDLWNGGYIEIVTCAASSELVGTMHKITDSVGSSGTLTVPTMAAALASGDTIRIHPGKLALTEFGWDLNSDGTDIDYTSSGGEAIQLFDVDPARKKSFWKLRLQQYASHPVAL